MIKVPSKSIVLACILLISIVGGVFAIYSTANGPWGYSDPVEYISSAHGLDQGLGLAYYEGDAKLTHEVMDAPLYSLMLAFIGLFGANLVAASRWLNVVSFILSIFIAGWIFYRYSRAPAVGILTSALMASFPYMVVMFSSAYSEPLFILSFLAGGLCLLAYLEKKSLSLFIISALLIGAIPGTRYPGLAMVGAAILAIFFFFPGAYWMRIKKAVLFGLLSGLPILIWFVWIFFSVEHNLAGRSLNLQWNGVLARFQSFRGIFMDTVWKWFPYQYHGHLMSYRLRFLLLGGIGFLLLVLSIFAFRHFRTMSTAGKNNSGVHIFAFFGFSLAIFTLTLLITYLFILPTIDIDDRILLPLFVSGVMMVFGAFALWQSAWFVGKLRFLKVIPWGIAAVCIAWYIPQTREKIQHYHEGDGMTVYRWNTSEIIQAVRALPPDQPVISNEWEMTTLWTGRPIYGFWTSFSETPPFQTTPYGTNRNDPFQMIFCEKSAALVIYNDFPSQVVNNLGSSARDNMLKLFQGLPVYGKYPDGTIYLCH